MRASCETHHGNANKQIIQPQTSRKRPHSQLERGREDHEDHEEPGDDLEDCAVVGVGDDCMAGAFVVGHFGGGDGASMRSNATEEVVEECKFSNAALGY